MNKALEIVDAVRLSIEHKVTGDPMTHALWSAWKTANPELTAFVQLTRDSIIERSKHED